jgi:hypothetical protein
MLGGTEGCWHRQNRYCMNTNNFSGILYGGFTHGALTVTSGSLAFKTRVL